MRMNSEILGLFLAYRSRSRQDPLVLGVIGAEIEVRPASARLAEYAAWFALTLIKPSRLPLLSVGIAQVQLRHWKALGFLSSCSFSVHSFLTVTDADCNYDICERLLEGVVRTPEAAAREYVGKVRPHYLKLVRQNMKLALLDPGSAHQRDSTRTL